MLLFERRLQQRFFIRPPPLRLTRVKIRLLYPQTVACRRPEHVAERKTGREVRLRTQGDHLPAALHDPRLETVELGEQLLRPRIR